jgi:diguanylate cyclase (GGDEF)-like protein
VSQSGRTSPALLLLTGLVLLQAVSATLVVEGGRGRVVEVVVAGIGCVAAYRLGWRRGRWASALVPLVVLLLESRYGRLGGSKYWEGVALAAGTGAAAFAAAAVRLTLDAREAADSALRERLAEQLAVAEIDARLGTDRRRRSTLAYELERARRHNHALSVLMVRADDFDEIMVRFGEDAAASTLQAVATSISRCLRTTDIPVRDGDIDFAVILPEGGREDARLVAERIRLAVAVQRLEFGPGDLVDLSVSIGVASFPHDATSNEQMTEAIRRALHAAIELGGNRTMLYSTPEGSPARWGVTRESPVS